MNPGSFDAIQRGCRCSPQINSYGRGLETSHRANPGFDIHPNCAVHPEGWTPNPTLDDVLGSMTQQPAKRERPKRERLCERCGEARGMRLDELVCARCRRAKAITGERNVHAKITQDQANEIRRRALTGEHQPTIAAEFGISRHRVSEIKCGKAWVA